MCTVWLVVLRKYIYRIGICNNSIIRSTFGPSELCVCACVRVCVCVCARACVSLGSLHTKCVWLS